MSGHWSGVGAIAIALVSCSSSDDRLAQDAVTMCEHSLQFPFAAEVFDFGERFGETDGDKVLSVIAESGSVEKPAAEDVASALAPAFDLTSEVEETAHEAEWFMNFESRDNGCRFSVQLSTDSFRLEVRDFERTWMLAFVERSPENQAFLAD